MSNPIVSYGNSDPIIRKHSESIDCGGFNEPPCGSFAIEIDWFSVTSSTEIKITIEPQESGAFVTRYEVKTVTP